MSNKSVVVNTLASCTESPGLYFYPSHSAGTAGTASEVKLIIMVRQA